MHVHSDLGTTIVSESFAVDKVIGFAWQTMNKHRDFRFAVVAQFHVVLASSVACMLLPQ